MHAERRGDKAMCHADARLCSKLKGIRVARMMLVSNRSVIFWVSQCTWIVGMRLCDDVLERPNGVGAEQEVVFHEQEVARKALRRSKQGRDGPSLPAHLPPHAK
jgi:hypothetical protein